MCVGVHVCLGPARKERLAGNCVDCLVRRVDEEDRDVVGREGGRTGVKMRPREVWGRSELPHGVVG